MRWLTIVGNTLRSLFQRRRAEAELETVSRSPGTGDREQHPGRHAAGGGAAAHFRPSAPLLFTRKHAGIGAALHTSKPVRAICDTPSTCSAALRSLPRRRSSPWRWASAPIPPSSPSSITSCSAPFPFAIPSSLAFLSWSARSSPFPIPTTPTCATANRVFSNLIAYRYIPLSMSVQARENHRIWGNEVSGNYFETRLVRPFLAAFSCPRKTTARRPSRPGDQSPPLAQPFRRQPQRRWPASQNQRLSLHRHRRRRPASEARS